MRVFLFLLLGLFALPAMAAQPLFYLTAGMGAGTAKGPGVATMEFESGQKFSDSANLFSLGLGFRIGSSFSVEAEYMDLGKFREQYQLDPDIVYIVAPNDTEELETKGLSISAVYTLGTFDPVDVLALVSFTTFDIDRALTGGFSPQLGELDQYLGETESGLGYGLGAKMQLTEGMAVRAQWMRHDMGRYDLDVLGLKLEYGL